MTMAAFSVSAVLQDRIWDKHTVSPRMAWRISIEARSPSGLSRILKRMGAHFTDLATCGPENEPLWGTYAASDCNNHPPAAGQLIEINIRRTLISRPWSTTGISALSRAMKIATADKDNKVSDEILRCTDGRLLKEYAAEMADRIKRGEKTDVVRVNSGSQESKHTTQVSRRRTR